MSQRSGPPQNETSHFCLRLVSCLLCSEVPNEWDSVWHARDELHHERAPLSEGRYKGHRLNLEQYDLRRIQPNISRL